MKPQTPDNDLTYQQQLDKKINRINTLFHNFAPPALEVFSSPEKGFRMRAEFKIWHQGDSSYYAMYRPGEYKKPYIIEHFPPGSSLINELMPKILTAINNSDTLRRKLFQLEFLTGLSGEAVISMIYHKKLGDDWKEQALALKTQYGIDIIGRSRKQKVVLERDFIIEKLSVGEQTFAYQQIESSFTQPNATVCQKMLTWAVEKSQNFGGDLVELYCGNGNFTLPLSQNFNKVIATELAKSSVASARYNIALNNIDNITVVRMASEEFSQALDKVREFRRLRDVDLDSYDFTTIFVDPPRAGMDEHTTHITQRFDNIIYISCNPDTLHRDLQQICQTHRIENFALFDQFPFTHHIECAVILKRR